MVIPHIARRRWLLRAGALSLGTIALPWRAAAQAGTIRLVCGFPPGGSVDALARIAGDALGPALGRTVIVENRTGAAGRLATEQVKAGPPDGSLLLVAPQGAMTLFPHVFKTLRYDPAKDFTPLARIAVGDFALTTGPMTGAKTLDELRVWMKANPDKAAFGSPGAGTLPHFVGLRIAEVLGVKMTHVPYRGSALSMNDLAGGTIPATVSPVTEALELHKAGRVRILATASAQRSPFVDDLPTLKELGHDIDVPLWYGLWGPAGMPSELVARINRVLGEKLTSAEAKQRIATLGLVPAPLPAAEIEALRQRELAMWASIVKASGFTPND